MYKIQAAQGSCFNWKSWKLGDGWCAVLYFAVLCCDVQYLCVVGSRLAYLVYGNERHVNVFRSHKTFKHVLQMNSFDNSQHFCCVYHRHLHFYLLARKLSLTHSCYLCSEWRHFESVKWSLFVCFFFSFVTLSHSVRFVAHIQTASQQQQQQKKLW